MANEKAHSKWMSHLYFIQYIVAALIVALATYTLTAFPDWKEVRVTVAAVYLPHLN